MQARVLPWYSTDHLLSQTAVARYRYPWEDRKKVLSQLPLTWTSWWKTAFPGDFSGTDGLKCMGNWCKHRNGRCWGQKVFFFKKWLLTHVFGGFQGHKSSASKLAPDASKFTRFKQDFLSDLQSMFDHLVNLTEPICQKRNPDLAGMTILIPPVLKHGLRKIILSMQIVLLNSWRFLRNPITGMTDTDMWQKQRSSNRPLYFTWKPENINLWNRFSINMSKEYWE